MAGTLFDHKRLERNVTLLLVLSLLGDGAYALGKR